MKPQRVFFDNDVDTSIQHRHEGLPQTYINTPETFPITSTDLINYLDGNHDFDVVVSINQDDYMENHTDPSGCKHKDYFMNYIFTDPCNITYRGNAILGINHDDFIVRVTFNHYP